MLSLAQFDGFLFDLDGVVWRGREPIPGAAEFIGSLRDAGKRVLFVTNNASAHRSNQQGKLETMCIRASLDEVITSAYATAVVLRERFGSLRVHVMGTPGLARELAEQGHEIVTEGRTDGKPVEAVVAGLDPHFDYQRLNAALQRIHRDGARFIACNDNPLYPREDGLYPGAGALIQALATCAGRQPDLIVGKPHRPILNVSLKAIGLSADRCVMFGDSLTHDIAWVQQAGMATVYLLSGVGTEEEVRSTGITPTCVLPSIASCRL